MFNILRPFIFKFSPELAHSIAIRALKFGYIPPVKLNKSQLLETSFFSNKLISPIGIAAGFDKNAEVYNPLFNLGFGFVEVGTVTPKRQYGNPKPRVFRLEEDQALINRLGFNNDGCSEVSSRIEKNKPKGLLGINIGPNKNSENRINDYVSCFRKFHNQADYITINISSPNTESLRDFHEKKELRNLINAVNSEKQKLKSKVQLAVKISPDLNQNQIESVSEILLENSIEIAIISNSTDNNRESLININKMEKGGLSGKPIEKISNNLINKFYKLIGKKIKIIGVGGVDSAEGVFEKILNGATLVQLYTGMVYKGPQIAYNINKGLINILKKNGIKNIGEVIGSKNSS
ncbi:MAG: quinone-dependent dihydroorotate dehydrogenase [Candidatus Pelagibacter sp. TMED118]|mgnify:CR=1 FL=1|nr:MAG: quinone-dependent dihydroorotate dehydrogenase [Candidatus Pelagibacter sp. TMED118]|tara:strand:- start:3340 stop:4386 length:1047 start_codon:yes stop_codon:yes gene_type:complete